MQLPRSIHMNNLEDVSVFAWSVGALSRIVEGAEKYAFWVGEILSFDDIKP